MQNQDQWQASKYVWRDGHLAPSLDERELGRGSRLIAGRVAAHYERALATYAGGRLLDLGCGKVPLYSAYRDRVSEAVCVDWAQTLHRNPHLDLECDLSQPLPLSTASFDTVLLSDVLEHIPEPAVLWNEMARVLRPGGHLLMNVPFLYWLHEEPHDYYRYTEHALRRGAAGAGLEVLALDRIGGAPEVLLDITGKLIARWRPGMRRLAWAVHGLGCRWLETASGRRASKNTAGPFPLGYFLVARRAAQ
ncbi:methyltransferase domain-containing protein [Ramlibacter sp. PS3R-8]|uniref:class I SAM-dependent methyltransferase n=1 Tax=Ramlibacter sp. PS3R-8 TaxID=3133437 RepID=UPI00309EB741